MKPRKSIIVAGSRELTDYQLVKSTLDPLLKYRDVYDIEIVSGGARGADKLGEDWARENGIHIELFPANWDTLKKKAGHIRNTQMANYAHMLIAFWNGDLEKSGTYNMIQQAKAKELIVKIVNI